MSTKVTINGKEYEASPLRVKHLRQITKMLTEGEADPKQGLFKTVERWMPFVVDSIKVKHADFTQEMMDEATLDEMLAAWNAIVSISGIKFIQGETKPAGSTGDSSTDASAVPSAGPTVM